MGNISGPTGLQQRDTVTRERSRTMTSRSRGWSLLFLLAPVAVAAVDLPPPALMVKAGEKSEPLPVSKIQVEARIHGFLAETRMTLTFANPGDRALEGD